MLAGTNTTTTTQIDQAKKTIIYLKTLASSRSINVAHINENITNYEELRAILPLLTILYNNTLSLVASDSPVLESIEKPRTHIISEDVFARFDSESQMAIILTNMRIHVEELATLVLNAPAPSASARPPTLITALSQEQRRRSSTTFASAAGDETPVVALPGTISDSAPAVALPAATTSGSPGALADGTPISQQTIAATTPQVTSPLVSPPAVERLPTVIERSESRSTRSTTRSVRRRGSTGGFGSALDVAYSTINFNAQCHAYTRKQNLDIARDFLRSGLTLNQIGAIFQFTSDYKIVLGLRAPNENLVMTGILQSLGLLPMTGKPQKIKDKTVKGIAGGTIAVDLPKDALEAMYAKQQEAISSRIKSEGLSFIACQKTADFKVPIHLRINLLYLSLLVASNRAQTPSFEMASKDGIDTPSLLLHSRDGSPDSATLSWRLVIKPRAAGATLRTTSDWVRSIPNGAITIITEMLLQRNPTRTPSHVEIQAEWERLVSTRPEWLTIACTDNPALTALFEESWQDVEMEVYILRGPGQSIASSEEERVFGKPIALMALLVQDERTGKIEARALVSDIDPEVIMPPTEMAPATENGMTLEAYLASEGSAAARRNSTETKRDDLSPLFVSKSPELAMPRILRKLRNESQISAEALETDRTVTLFRYFNEVIDFEERYVENLITGSGTRFEGDVLAALSHRLKASEDNNNRVIQEFRRGAVTTSEAATPAGAGIALHATRHERAASVGAETEELGSASYHVHHGAETSNPGILSSFSRVLFFHPGSHANPLLACFLTASLADYMTMMHAVAKSRKFFIPIHPAWNSIEAFLNQYPAQAGGQSLVVHRGPYAPVPHPAPTNATPVSHSVPAIAAPEHNELRPEPHAILAFFQWLGAGIATACRSCITATVATPPQAHAASSTERGEPVIVLHEARADETNRETVGAFAANRGIGADASTRYAVPNSTDVDVSAIAHIKRN